MWTRTCSHSRFGSSNRLTIDTAGHLISPGATAYVRRHGKRTWPAWSRGFRARARRPLGWQWRRCRAASRKDPGEFRRRGSAAGYPGPPAPRSIQEVSPILVLSLRLWRQLQQSGCFLGVRARARAGVYQRNKNIPTPSRLPLFLIFEIVELRSPWTTGIFRLCWYIGPAGIAKWASAQS